MSSLKVEGRQSTARRLVDLAIVLCLLAGETAGWLLFPAARPPLRLSVVFWAGLGLLLIRHVIWRTPTIFTLLWSLARERLASPAQRRLAALIVLTRVGVLAVGLVASLSSPEVFASFPRLSRHPLENLPARWDGFWYHNVARGGYRWDPVQPDEQQNIAFFPAYPLLMRTGGDIITIPAKVLRDAELFGSGAVRVMWGGVLASVACFTVAMWRLFRLASDEAADASAALRACVLFATYPFALFFSMPYSESLALLALISVTLAWREGRTRSGVLWGLVLGLSRPNGWTIAVALLVDRLLGVAYPWKPGAGWIFMTAAPLAGAAMYSGYVHRVTGYPFEWAAAQRAWGAVFQPSSFLMRRWQRITDEGPAGYITHDPVDALTFVALMLMVGLALWLASQRRWLYAVLMLAYITPAVVIDLPAAGRMTALLFPAFLVLGSRLSGASFLALTAMFALGQAWFAWRFFLWRSPY
jgi:hypothetical protein